MNKDRKYVIASNKHRQDDYLQFWGELTKDEEKRCFGGYPADIERCEKYTFEELKSKGYVNTRANSCGFPIFSDKTDRIKLQTEEHYIIKLTDLFKVFRKFTGLRVYSQPIEAQVSDE